MKIALAFLVDVDASMPNAPSDPADLMMGMIAVLQGDDDTGMKVISSESIVASDSAKLIAARTS